MRTIRTTKRRRLFLAALAAGNSVAAACAAAGIGRATVYEWKDEDDLFSAQWEDAFEAGTDTLEDELTRRALTGSDACLIFALKGRRPARWRPAPQKTVMVQDPELLRDAEQTRRIREMSDEELQAEIDHIDEMRRQLNRPRLRRQRQARRLTAPV